MAKIKVVLEVDLGEPGVTALTTEEQIQMVRGVVCSALSEFEATRTPAKEYMDVRYPPEKYLWDRAEKMADVELRAFVARKLHHQATEWAPYTEV